MRLALISSLLPGDSRGGAESYAQASALSLAERHDVVLLTGSRHATINGVRTIRVPRLPLISSSTPGVARVLWHAADQWLPHVHVAVSRALRREKPDLVVTHHPQGLSAAVFTAVAAQRLPHVHVAHDLNILCSRMSMTRRGVYCGGSCVACRIQRAVRGRALGLNLAALIVFSRYMLEQHVRAGVVPRDRATAVRLGADPGAVRLRRITREPPTVGFIGALEPHKGLLTLLDAFHAAERNRWRLLIAGSGRLEPDVVRASSRDPRIGFVGQVEGAAKDGFFDRTDLLIVPSEWEEPATFVVAEGAVRGIPTIVSDRGGLPEAPEARVFRAGDPHGLVEAMAWFLDHPVRLERASARLIERAHEFRWSTHVDQVDRLLQDVLARSSDPG
jgi:glycosyltransferase involved in cell wall biosynthesis